MNNGSQFPGVAPQPPTITPPSVSPAPGYTPPPLINLQPESSPPDSPKVNDVTDPYASASTQNSYTTPISASTSGSIFPTNNLEGAANPSSLASTIISQPPQPPQRVENWTHLFGHFHPKLLAQLLAVLVVMVAGVMFAVSKISQPPASNLAQQAAQDSTATDTGLVADKDKLGTLSINYDTVVSDGKTLTASEIIAGGEDKKLLLTGDFQSTGTIFTSDGAVSLSADGLKINNVTVCTEDGCTASNVTPTTTTTTSSGGTTTTTTAKCTYGNCVSLQSSAPGTSETGNIRISGKVTAATFSGNGASITSVNAATLQGNNAAYFKDADNLTSGTLDPDRIASNSISYAKLDLSADIVNADISTSAAIAYSKLNLTGNIANADISTSAAIAYSKFNLA